MKRHIWHKLLLLMGIWLLVACRQNDCSQAEETASLQLMIKTTGSSLHTRGVEDLDDNGTVTEGEIIVDGRKMYRLSVFLLNGSQVVSSTVLEAGDQRFTNNNTEATVSFNNLDYTKTYKLYAVANYGDYNGLTGKLREVTAGNMTVSASDEKLCNKNTPYPLTLAKDISLSPGVNSVSGELVRTYARIRINVRNQSATNNLAITKLSFPAKFTQNSVDIFTEGGTADAQPVVTSADAITPFDANTAVIPMLDDKSNVSEKTIFDSYLLESTGGDYKYTLGVKYEGGTKEDYEVNTTPITNAINIEDGLYVIYNTNARRYLFDNGDNVGAGSSYQNNGELNHNYVWKFTSTGTNNRYTIQSMGGSGKFMQSSGVSNSTVPLTTSVGDSDYFTASVSGSNIRFQSTKSSYYLSVNGSTVCGHNSNWNQNPRNFYLYKVTKEVKVSSVTKEETIPIHIIDKNTGEASPLTAIKRNDFINILVNVTYNEKTGEVQFEVADWDEVNGEVEFD